MKKLRVGCGIHLHASDPQRGSNKKKTVQITRIGTHYSLVSDTSGDLAPRSGVAHSFSIVNSCPTRKLVDERSFKAFSFSTLTSYFCEIE